jgi:hypothetical protein
MVITNMGYEEAFGKRTWDFQSKTDRKEKFDVVNAKKLGGLSNWDIEETV